MEVYMLMVNNFNRLYIKDKNFEGGEIFSLRALLALASKERPNSMAQINDVMYYNLRRISAATGMVNYEAMKHVIVDSNYQIFKLRKTPEKTKTLVSYDRDHVSDDHCQSGTEKDIYQIHVPPGLG